MKGFLSFLGCFLMFGHSGVALATPVEDLIAAAKKEGVIELLAPSTTGQKGIQALGDAFNKKYGLSIKVNYSPSSNMTGDVAKVVMGAASGAAPEWDLMLVTDAHHATLWSRKLLQTFDYAKLGVAPELIQYDNGTVSLANQFVLPAYNKKILAPQDVPKRWEDLLNPKLKGGKLGVSTATHHLSRLAWVHGERKRPRNLSEVWPSRNRYWEPWRTFTTAFRSVRFWSWRPLRTALSRERNKTALRYFSPKVWTR
jgi:spermidine/putrescine-binding protein